MRERAEFLRELRALSMHITPHVGEKPGIDIKVNQGNPADPFLDLTARSMPENFFASGLWLIQGTWSRIGRMEIYEESGSRRIGIYVESKGIPYRISESVEDLTDLSAFGPCDIHCDFLEPHMEYPDDRLELDADTVPYNL